MEDQAAHVERADGRRELAPEVLARRKDDCGHALVARGEYRTAVK